MGNYEKYLYSSGTHYISNNGHDENGGYSGGVAGDQTGDEWCLRSWYSRPWNCVLRYPDESVALKIAELGCAAALNDLIGYDQNQRDTYWEHLKASNYDPSQITVACEADCSAGVIANVKAAGYLMGISALQNISATYTGNMRSAFKSAGFEVLTGDKYINGYAYLKPGDILLNDSAHTATNVTKGGSASFNPDSGSGSDTNTGTNESISEIADEVIAGKWGNDPERKEKLTAAGYDYDAIQAVVNEKLGVSSTNTGNPYVSLPSYVVGETYAVKVDALTVRTGAGIDKEAKSYSELTTNAKANAYSSGALKKGTKVTCFATTIVNGNEVWMQIPSGYVAAFYDNKKYVG